MTRKEEDWLSKATDAVVQKTGQDYANTRKRIRALRKKKSEMTDKGFFDWILTLSAENLTHEMLGVIFSP